MPALTMLIMFVGQVFHRMDLLSWRVRNATKAPYLQNRSNLASLRSTSHSCWQWNGHPSMSFLPCFISLA
jgi:hypothetical protein